MFVKHGKELWDGSSTLCEHSGVEMLAVHNTSRTWGCWRLNFQPSANAMLQPVLGQGGSNHQCVTYLSPSLFPLQGRQMQSGQLQPLGMGGGTPPRAGKEACTNFQPKHSFLYLCCKKSSCLTLPSPPEKSDRQSSPFLSCTAPCRHHPNPSASRQCHLRSGRHLNMKCQRSSMVFKGKEAIMKVLGRASAQMREDQREVVYPTPKCAAVPCVHQERVVQAQG